MKPHEYILFASPATVFYSMVTASLALRLGSGGCSLRRYWGHRGGIVLHTYSTRSNGVRYNRWGEMIMLMVGYAEWTVWRGRGTRKNENGKGDTKDTPCHWSAKN